MKNIYTQISWKAGSIMAFVLLSICFNPIAANNLQSRTISGKVVAASDESALPGVNVVVKGQQEGTITDVDGNYALQVSGDNVVLVFSYVGFNTEEIMVGTQSIINITLEESMEALNEIVVTALGIRREEQSLGFSIGRVDGEEVNRVAQENVLNSLSGKVAGVTINSTGGTGSSVSMVIRGATSLSSDNQPLFVVDGVPVVNTLNNMTQFGDRNIVDYGNAISDINPEDVESISVLKGPSAAALYGSRAGNGVVIITTKSGARQKRPTVNFSSNTVFDIPYSYLNVQKKFATGFFSFTPDNFPAGTYPVIDPAQAAGAGMELDRGYFGIQWNAPLDANGVPVPTELVSHPDNVANFVETAVTTTNGVSFSNSNDVLDYRIGFTNMSSKGMIPNSDLFRNNLTLSSSLKASKKFTISTNLNVNRTWSNNRPSSNRGTNPLEWAYAMPQNLDIRDFKDYWEPGQEGVQQKTPSNGNYDNPYFLANEVQNSFSRDRAFGNLKAEWQISPEFTLMGRYSLDYFVETRETKISPSYTREPNNGTYGIVDFSNFERNIDFLATYAKQFDKLGLSVSAGGNSRYFKGTSLSNYSSAGLVVPNLYTVSNIKQSALVYNSAFSEEAIYSAYGIANLSWDDYLYFDVTARNDWSSTLPPEDNSYFYPAFSLSLLLDEMVSLGSNVDMLKIRAGWAQVGNDASPYSLYPTWGNAGQWGDAIRLAKPGSMLVPDLKPEKATSPEIGLDLTMFGERLRFEGTYYQVLNENQIIPGIPLASSSGFTQMTINAGLIESKGWEFMLGGTPVKSNGWTWDLSANYSRNRTTIKELAPGVDLIRFWEDAKGGAWTYVGEQIGDIYDAEMVRVKDPSSPYYGYPIIGGGDLEWQSNDGGAQQTKNKIGNYNPDFIIGMQTSLAWKNFSLSATIDWRSGGQYVSQTYRYTTENASSQLWLDGAINPEGRTGKELRDWLVENEDKFIKDGFNIVGGPTAEYGGFPEKYSGQTVYDGIFIPGVIQVAGADTETYEDDVYQENLGEDLDETILTPYVVSYPWDFTEASTFDADFVKLRELSINYLLPNSFIQKMKLRSGSISVYTRNVIIWTKGQNGIDPERAFQAESSTGSTRGTQFKQGIERYNVDPWVFPIGFKLNLTF